MLIPVYLKFFRFIEYAYKKKTRAKQAKINTLFYRYLMAYISFQLLSLFSVDWFLFGTFLFLVCSSIRIIIPTFATEITNKGIEYATSKEADESQRTNPSSDEAVERRKQEFVSGYLPRRKADIRVPQNVYHPGNGQ